MSIKKRKKRLLFRCWHRGSRESDLLLGNFANERLADMGESDVTKLETIVDCDDQLIWDWVIGVVSVPPGINSPMIGELRSIYSKILAK